jgi:hypothetical protein
MFMASLVKFYNPKSINLIICHLPRGNISSYTII